MMSTGAAAWAGSAAGAPAPARTASHAANTARSSSGSATAARASAEVPSVSRAKSSVRWAAAAQGAGQDDERAEGAAAHGRRVAAWPVTHLKAAAQQRLLALGVPAGAGGERLLEDDVGEAREDLEHLVADRDDLAQAAGVAQRVDVARGQRRRVAVAAHAPGGAD